MGLLSHSIRTVARTSILDVTGKINFAAMST